MLAPKPAKNQDTWQTGTIAPANPGQGSDMPAAAELDRKEML
jgi:hypothetical protein